MEKGFRVYIYRTEALGDCTNHGITSHAFKLSQVTLIGQGVPQQYAPDSTAPALFLRRDDSGYPSAIPELPEHPHHVTGRPFYGKTWWMFGGNFIYSSDSRFAALNNGAPIAVHDRTEGWRRPVITYATLPRNPKPDIVLSCPECGSRYSARRGDYFLFEPSVQPTCGECGVPLQLTREVRRFVEISAEEAEQ